MPAKTTAATIALDDLIAGLRRWLKYHDLNRKAAVELLIEHDSWLRRSDFRREAVHVDHSDGEHWINFTDAREAFDRGQFDRASSTELAILDLAIDLGNDRYRFNSMGRANSSSIVKAVTAALDGRR